jgi:hypothetical protein
VKRESLERITLNYHELIELILESAGIGSAAPISRPELRPYTDETGKRLIMVEMTFCTQQSNGEGDP